MPTPTQTAVAATTLGGGALGGYFLADALNSSNDNKNQSETNANDATKTETTPEVYEIKDLLTAYNNRFLGLTKKDHLPFLVKSSKNQEWWNKAYESKYKTKRVDTQIDEVFKYVTQGWSETAVTNPPAKQIALNQACEAAYKKEKPDYKFGSTDYLLRNISDFCTKEKDGYDVSEPKSNSYEEAYTPTTGYEYGLLSQTNNRTKLVTKDGVNDLWWKWAHKNLFLTTTEKSQLFSSVKSDYSDTVSTALNQVCHSSYKKPYVTLSDANNKVFKDIKRFCTPGKTSDETLILPIGEPTTVDFLGDNAGFNSAFAKDSGNKTKLIDPSKSEEWWKWMYFNYYPHADNSEKNKLRDPFDKVTTAYETSVNTALNQTCKTAYSKDKAALEASDNQKPKLIDLIKKFCLSSQHRSGDDLNNPTS